MSRPLLVLRPAPDAAVTATRAEALGLTAIVRPLFGGVALPWVPPAGDFDAVMMTSANAVRFGGSGLAAYQGLKLFTVGQVTADAAAAAGFTVIDPGRAGVDALLMQIAAEMPRRILHFTGRDQTPYADPRFVVVRVIVYAMEPLPAPALPPTAVALLHSARAATRLAMIIPDRAQVDIVAISASAAGTGWRSVQWPDVPSDAAMLALAAPLCES
jgi:uroporphyrinogen-III synthase